MEGLKQRSWIIVPVLAGLFVIFLVINNAQAMPGMGTNLAGVRTFFNAPSNVAVLASHTEWTMDGLNPARTRARELPFSQPITKQRVINVPEDVGDGSPPVISQNLIVVEAPGGLRSVDLRSGKQRWSTPLPGILFSPAIADGHVFARSETNNQGKLIALSFDTGEELWSFVPERLSSYSTSFLGGHLTSPVVVDGRVIVGAGNKVYALDAASGVGQWAFSTHELVTSSATVFDGLIYIADFGQIYALDFATGQQVWGYNTESSISWAPIAAGGMLIAKNGTEVVALDLKTGEERWSLPSVDRELVPSAATETIVYLKSETDIVAIEISSGKELWKFTDEGFVSLPMVAGNELFVVTGMGPASALTVLSTETGAYSWRMPVENLSSTAPIMSGQTIYLRTTDGRVIGYWR
jgi:outer membrane protein assembly factor BamB